MFVNKIKRLCALHHFQPNRAKVQKFLAGQKPKKIIFVKGKLVNVVV